jgi:uncharacterized membrane protein
VLIVQSIILLAIGYQSKFEKDNREIFGGFGIVGLYLLIAILTIEQYDFLNSSPLDFGVEAFRSLTTLWSVYALFWITLASIVRSVPIRICGLIVLFGALAKTTFIDSAFPYGYYPGWEWAMQFSLDHWIVLANPYFLTMLCPVIPAIVIAVWVNREKTIVGFCERIAWKVAGIIGLIALLIYLSVECWRFFGATASALISVEGASSVASASLTLFWTMTALLITTVALFHRSKTLRIMSMLLLLLAVLKVFGDLPSRLAFRVPFFNPYFFPMFVLALAVLVAAHFWTQRLEQNSLERKIYRVFAFFGVAFLWLVLSAECFQSVRLLTEDSAAWKAQMALSILWSLFAGVLIGIGFIWQSATLRWMAIILFATTLLKILIVDMSGVNELYRFGAVFALASLLALATWAYQRFKPEK